MKTNIAKSYTAATHEGGAAWPHATVEQQLRRSVLSCLLWEDEFYEDGKSIATRIAELAAQVPPKALAGLAIEARHKQHLRHVPLWLLCSLAKTGKGMKLVADTIEQVISRADELSEFVALYWKDGKRPLSAQIKKGLARAFRKFSAHQLAKYNRDEAVKLRDVLFLCHAKPKNAEQAETWKQLINGTLKAPDTWEVALSGGADKKATFERLIVEEKLGYLALLRNLRNMMDAGCDETIVRAAIIQRRGAERVLPFRYVSAARACPRMEGTLDQALLATLANVPPLPGMTAILVDVSGSMNDRLSGKSDLTRMDAAATLASMLTGTRRVFTFSNSCIEIPARLGMSGIDAIRNSQPHQSTRLMEAVTAINNEVAYDRLIVITDEQAHPGNGMPAPKGRGYLINVASNKNGVGYGPWVHIDGFSEHTLRWIAEHESAR